MKQLFTIAALLFISLTLFVFSPGCSDKKNGSPQNEKLLVMTSIYPAADIIRNIGGGKVEVKTLVQPGQSPHTFEPLPREMESVSRADVFILIGFGLEFWADKLLANVQNQRMIKLIYSDYVTPIKGNEAKDHGSHEHGGFNPHIWLSPKNAIVMAKKTRDTLTEAMPTAAGEFDANCASYVAELEKLDAWTKSVVDSLQNKRFVSFHPAWSYLARDYGLVEAETIEISPGVEPTPKSLSRIIESVRALGVKAVFTEPQFNPKTAEIIAAEAGIKVSMLDPFGGPDAKNRDTYVKLIRYNVEALQKVLK